ncbi:MAG: hypothetical protein OSA38_07910, partial [Candidatus Poseidoniaceae archaeon]|nr:hypothetical protein [Candidatus Poseidoniaceae archaeon]
MGDEHNARTASLEARLTSVKMEIDDDDEDVLFVTIDMTNEAAIPIGGLSAYITTSSGQKIEALTAITSLGPGLTRTFTFEFPLDTGTWTYTLSGSDQTLSLGPYEAHFNYEAEEGRTFGNAIGSSLFSGAFDANLDSFGQVQEKELIDASTVVMTSYQGENAVGGATKVKRGSSEKKPSGEEGPRKPPWAASEPKTSTPDPLSAPLGHPDPLLAPLSPTPAPTAVLEDEPIDLLALTLPPSVAEAVPEPQPIAEPEAAPAPAPPVMKTGPKPPPLPSSGPTTGPPSSPPSGPPTGPPSG